LWVQVCVGVMVEGSGDSVRVVEWSRNRGNGGAGTWRERRRMNSNFKRGGDRDKIVDSAADLKQWASRREGQRCVE
nr:hypothetical protein [Tanacetum cinerariifolium]